MRFKPLSEEELDRSMLFPEGEYHYTVIHAEEKISPAGNEYIALKLKIVDKEGSSSTVFTNLAFIKLLKHFCDVNGLEEEYNIGHVPWVKCMDKCGGKVLIGFEGEKLNPKGGVFKAKNIVLDYIKSSEVAMKPLPAKKDEFFDDSIPF